MDIQMITIPVEVIGEYFVLLDKQGNQLVTKKIHRDCLLNPSMDSMEQVMWGVAIRKATDKINRHNNIVPRQTPWQRKFDSLAKSFSHRTRDLKLLHTRKRFEQYPTCTWTKTVKRMIEQSRNCYVYHCESPWKRWVTCACKNNNRRSLTRYGKNN